MSSLIHHPRDVIHAMTARSICIHNVELIRQSTRNYVWKWSGSILDNPLQCDDTQMCVKYFSLEVLSHSVYLTETVELLAFALYAKWREIIEPLGENEMHLLRLFAVSYSRNLESICSVNFPWAKETIWVELGKCISHYEPIGPSAILNKLLS